MILFAILPFACVESVPELLAPFIKKKIGKDKYENYKIIDTWIISHIMAQFFTTVLFYFLTAVIL